MDVKRNRFALMLNQLIVVILKRMVLHDMVNTQG